MQSCCCPKNQKKEKADRKTDNSCPKKVRNIDYDYRIMLFLMCITK